MTRHRILKAQGNRPTPRDFHRCNNALPIDVSDARRYIPAATTAAAPGGRYTHVSVSQQREGELIAFIVAILPRQRREIAQCIFSIYAPFTRY